MTAENAVYDPTKDNSLDDYDYKNKTPFNWARRFLWFCAGADGEILKNCPYSERVKEEGIGGVVLATATLALLSGGYAFYTVFSPKVGNALSSLQQVTDGTTFALAVIFGLVWSAIIFNLDRFVVSSTGHGDGTANITGGEFVGALPRLALAIVIGFSLSAPLEIRIMKSEIEAELNKKQMQYQEQTSVGTMAKFSEKLAHQEKSKSEAESFIREKDSYLEKLRMEVESEGQQLSLEAEGKTLSGMAGEGPAWRTKKENLNRRMASLADAKASFASEKERLIRQIKQAESNIETLRNERDAALDVHKKEANNLDGLVVRIQIAHEISPVISWSLTALLIVIEIAPIFFKLMVIRGPYEYLKKNQEEIVKAKWGITNEFKISPGDKNEQHMWGTFHRAESIRDFHVGQINAEQQLVKVAQEQFIKQVSEDIRLNPDKYIVSK